MKTGSGLWVRKTKCILRYMLRIRRGCEEIRKEEAIGSLNKENNTNVAAANAKDDERIITLVNIVRRGDQKQMQGIQMLIRQYIKMVAQGHKRI